MDKKTSNKYRNTMALWRSEHTEDYDEFLKIVKEAENGDITLIQRMSQAVMKKWWYIPVLKVAMNKYIPEKLRTKFLNIVFNESADNLKENEGTFIRCCLTWLYLDRGSQTFVKLSNNINKGCKFPYQKLILSLIGQKIMSLSIENHMDTKSSWQSSLNEIPIEDTELKKHLKMMKSDNRGKNYNDVPLEDIIKDRNCEQVIDAIEILVHKRSSDTQLAYIQFILLKAGFLKDEYCSYAIFHRALQHQFPNEGIGGEGRAQNLYNRLYGEDPTKLSENEKEGLIKWRSIVSLALSNAIQ